jgi:UDP-N-acetylglucosamine 4,6-dehydratase
MDFQRGIPLVGFGAKPQVSCYYLPFTMLSDYACHFAHQYSYCGKKTKGINVLDYEFLRDKTLLITGGTGSFGKAAAKLLLRSELLRKVIIFSRDEWKQWEMQNSDPIFRHPNIRYFLGDVRDYMRLRRAFDEVDYIIHAAALKQVPAAEYNPTEFIKTNVDGATHIINAAIDCRVRGVVALSTDKAVNPINLYGATKLCSDKLFTAANAYVGYRGEPRFCVVRYGNVINSRGSLIPFWRSLLAQGVKELPVTDERMTRFWVTLEEAVHFVLSCLAVTVGGEVFVPKIPSMHIVDVAKALEPAGCKYKVIGIRPGEKLHEVLVSSEEGRHTLEAPKYYIVVPETHLEDKVYLENMRARHNVALHAVAEDFAYTSNNNSEWLDASALAHLLNDGGLLPSGDQPL